MKGRWYRSCSGLMLKLTFITSIALNPHLRLFMTFTKEVVSAQPVCVWGISDTMHSLYGFTPYAYIQYNLYTLFIAHKHNTVHLSLYHMWTAWNTHTDSQTHSMCGEWEHKYTDPVCDVPSVWHNVWHMLPEFYQKQEEGERTESRSQSGRLIRIPLSNPPCELCKSQSWRLTAAFALKNAP